MPESLRRLVGSDRATVSSVLLARAEATPDRVFVRSGTDTYTFGNIADSSRRFAGLTSKLGLQPGARIGSFLGNCPEYFTTWFGTYLGGHTYVPINRAHRGAVLADMLLRSSAQALVVDATARESLPRAEDTGLTTVIVIGTGEDLPPFADLGYEVLSFEEVDRSDEAPVVALDPSDIANVMYTSGTTGRSKGVLVPHNQLCRGGARLVEISRFAAEDIIHGWAPLFHLGAQQDAVLPVLLTGAEYALYPTFSLSSFWDEIKTSSATVFGGFSALIELLWAQPEGPQDAENTLRLGLVGLIPPAIHRDFERRFGVRLMEVYGLTEAEPLAMPKLDEATPVGSCGRPTPDFEVAVVDDHDIPVLPGKQGEIVARPKVADIMMRGYEGDEAATVAALRNLWFHTGDIGYFDKDGFLFFVDRRKHSIRRRGENISSWEVEALLRQHIDVEDVAVIAVPSPLGEDDIKACVVRRTGSTLTAEELHAFSRENMARFMVPRYIVFLDDLPYTETGKLRKEPLQQELPDTWDAEAKSRA